MSKQNQWTDEEHGFIQDHPDWPAARIAAELGRSAESVREKRRKIANGWVPAQSAWSDDDIAFLLDSPHLTAQEIASRLGRTKGSVEVQRRRLAKAGTTVHLKGRHSPYGIGGRSLLARTCRQCGLLLAGRWFKFNAARLEWSSSCIRCSKSSNPKAYQRDAAEGAKYRRKMEMMTTPALNSRQPWLDADLKVLADPDLTILEKAWKLGRTYNATSVACSLNGFTSKVGLGDPERDQWKIDNPNAKEYAL